MRIFPLSQNALTVEFDDVISPEVNNRAIELCRAVEADPFPGFIEAVPAYATVTIFYDLAAVRAAAPFGVTAFDRVRGTLERMIGSLSQSKKTESRRVEIPVSFGGEAGPDLEAAARLSGLGPDEFVSIFIERDYRVYMLGFLPGFPYMGEVDERIAVPRLATPRTRVAGGSVGIAGRQTGIYPLESPGGWHIIGRTDERLFDAGEEPPALLQPGDVVSFRAI